MNAEQGIVRIHAMTMRWPQIQRTERTPRVVPTPRIAPVIACVVEIGMPQCVAAMIVVAAAVSAQKPPTGCRRVMPEPIVFTIRHPPNIVPSAIATWQVRMIHSATLCVVAEDVEVVEPVCPGRAASSAHARRRRAACTMMPIVFCASFPPWPRLIDRGGEQLHAAEGDVDLVGVDAPEDPRDRDHEQRPEQEPDDRREDDEQQQQRPTCLAR